MNLLHYLLKQTQLWAGVFRQQRSHQRALALAFGILCGVGRRTLTRAISFQGNTQKDWSADYKVFSRSPWEPRALFGPILEQAIQTRDLQRVVISIDDTRVWRNGQHVPQTQWHRDPLGPPFQTNLRWGHRFLQAYGRLKKEKNLSVQFVAMVRELRQQLNQSGHAGKRFSVPVDGSFCNGTVFRQDGEEEKVSLVARCRKDIVLCKRAPGKGPRFYGKTKFTPAEVRQRDAWVPWQFWAWARRKCGMRTR